MSDGSLWDSITNFIEPVVDWTAETLGYVDEVVDDLDTTGVMEGMSAGDYLKEDLSSAFGFIRKGASAYIKSTTDKQFQVKPNIGSGRKTIGLGTTSVKGVSRKTTKTA